MDRKAPNDRLKEAREKYFGSARAAAIKHGWALSTYSTHEAGSRKFKQEDAIKYGRAFGVDPVWLMFGVAGKARTDLPVGASARRLTAVPMVGEVAAGVWLEAELPSSEGLTPLNALISDDWPPDALFAVKVRGESLNKIASDGDHLLCVDILRAGLEVRDGDLVIVERSQQQGGLVEMTAKRLRERNGVTELWPESNDPQFQQPITLVDNDNDDSQAVTIRARVVSINKDV